MTTVNHNGKTLTVLGHLSPRHDRIIVMLTDDTRRTVYEVTLQEYLSDAFREETKND
jgi:hypothetical protein